MIKPILKTLSFSFVTLASAAILSASDQGPGVGPGAPASARVGCSAPSEIDLGWEEQLAQIEKRLAEKEAEGLAVPGAIITPPFETFAPYRTDVPPTATANRAAKTARPVASGQPSHD